jgi:restriction endonuclease S subunit
MRNGWVETTLNSFLKQSKLKVKVHKGEIYPAIGVMMEGRGFVTREPFVGGKTTYKFLTPIKPNQLVLRSITAWEAPIQVTSAEHDGFHVSGVFPVFDIDSSIINPRFLALHCQYNPFWEFMRERTVGSVLRRKTLSASALTEIPISLPPLTEQNRIVDLISSVDSYIEALQQQADKTRKSRNAVLHELLTKGVKGWIETTLGELVSISTGKLDVNAEKEFGNYPFFTCANEVYRIDMAAFDGEFVIIAGNGDLNVKYYNGKFNAYQRTYVIGSLDKNALCNKFLYFFMQEYIEYLRSESRGTTIQYLKKGQFTEAKLSLPPLAEQKRIVEIISVFDNQIEVLDSTITKIRNLRSALLSDLLSGNHEIPSTYDKLIGAA